MLKKPLKKTGQLYADRRGAIGPLFALLLVPAMMFTGMAVDYGRAVQARDRLQSVVDGSAQAGARLPATANQNRMTAAQMNFTGNTAGSAMAGITPTIQANNSQVSVTASFQSPTSLLGLVGINSLEVSATSTARSQIQNGGVVCMLALSPTASNGLYMNGVTKFTGDNCWTWVNSTSGASIDASNNAVGIAQGFCTAGAVSGASAFRPAPFEHCDPMSDPFKDRINSYNPPGLSACTSENTNREFKSGTHNIQPGTYCGTTIIRPQAVVNMAPGTYIFRDGKLDIRAGSTLNGPGGVTLFFYGQNTTMTTQAGSNLDLKAPAGGDLAGFVIVDRKIDWYDSTVRGAEIQGGGSVKIEGILYAPQWQLSIGGNSDMNQLSSYFAIVADNVRMIGNGKVNIKSDYQTAGLPDLMPKIKNGPLILK